MAEHMPGEWYLIIDLGQPISGAELDPALGILRVPFASQQSVHVAAGRLKLGILEPPMVIQGEVITEREAIENG